MRRPRRPATPQLRYVGTAPASPAPSRPPALRPADRSPSRTLLPGAALTRGRHAAGQEEKAKKLLGRLHEEFEKCQIEHQLPRGDLPNVDRYRAMLASYDIMKFPKVERRSVDIMDAVLSQDLPAIMRQFENPF